VCAVGKIITIKAWWRNDRHTKVEILEISKWGVTVRPIEGNPHNRFFSLNSFNKLKEE
jgi:hypothetical protein